MSFPTASHKTTTLTTIISSLFSKFFPTTDSKKLQDLSASPHNYLVDKLSSACDAQESAGTSGTNAKLYRAWIRWVKFLTHIELQHDEFLKNFVQEDRFPSENENFHAAVRRTWLATRAKRPWKKWQSSLGKTAGLTPAITYPETLTTISDCNTAYTPTTTPQQSNKRPPLHPSTDTTTTDTPPRSRKRLAFYPSPLFSGPANTANKRKLHPTAKRKSTLSAISASSREPANYTTTIPT